MRCSCWHIWPGSFQLPANWDIRTALPLHLSDLSLLAAAYTLWTRRRWAFALTYYWGLTITPAVLITPALNAADFPHVIFFDFWTEHAFVLWAACYLTWGLGMRPDWRSYTTAVSTTVAWGAAIMFFNALAGTNYGYLSSKPDSTSPLDAMGPWPWYIAVEYGLGLVVWALITWPWTRFRPAGALASASPDA